MISGPLNNDSEGNVPWYYPLTVLEINETHPAVVRCQVTCLDQQGFYRPAMAIIITSQEQFITVAGYRDIYSRDGLDSEIRIGDLSHCEAQNNYTMEFEYLIIANASTIARSVVICGVEFHDWPPYSQHICWGQSYGIIHYNHERTDAMADTTTQVLTTTDVRTTPDPIPDVIACCLRISTEVGVLFPALFFVSITINIILLLITISLIIAFLHLKSVAHRRLNVKAPQCVQTVEQTLVIKAEQSSDLEKKVKEKETSLDEDSNVSLVQVQLQQKLPDTISSRSKTL